MEISYDLMIIDEIPVSNLFLEIKHQPLQTTDDWL